MKEAVVAERAKARWQSLIKRDYEGAYTYFSPSSREATSLSNFQTRIAAIEYRAVTIDKVECVVEVCKVNLTLTYDYPPGEGKGSGHSPRRKLDHRPGAGVVRVPRMSGLLQEFHKRAATGPNCLPL